MHTVGSYEAKTHLPQLLERVERGETITITRHGKPVARLVPAAAASPAPMLPPPSRRWRNSRRRKALRSATRSPSATSSTRDGANARSADDAAMDGYESLVLDCSVTMAWYFKDEANDYTNAVRTAWRQAGRGARALAARSRQRAPHGRTPQAFDPVQGRELARLPRRLPIAVDTQTPGLGVRSDLDLARSHKLSAYDAAYLELAMRLGLPFAGRE